VDIKDLMPDSLGEGKTPTPDTERQQQHIQKVTSTGFIRKNIYVLHGNHGDEGMTSQALDVASMTQTNQNTAMALKPVLSATEVSEALVDHKARRVREARMKGFEGDACKECGNFTLVRNGTCMKCNTCGGTTGCS
jgi:ribonucleoside-diphosphate reductase alpha chain